MLLFFFLRSLQRLFYERLPFMYRLDTRSVYRLFF